jgi:hypothetical protein
MARPDFGAFKVPVPTAAPPPSPSPPLASAITREMLSPVKPCLPVVGISVVLLLFAAALLIVITYSQGQQQGKDNE